MSKPFANPQNTDAKSIDSMIRGLGRAINVLQREEPAVKVAVTQHRMKYAVYLRQKAIDDARIKRINDLRSLIHTLEHIA